MRRENCLFFAKIHPCREKQALLFPPADSLNHYFRASRMRFFQNGHGILPPDRQRLFQYFSVKRHLPAVVILAAVHRFAHKIFEIELQVVISALLQQPQGKLIDVIVG